MMKCPKERLKLIKNKLAPEEIEADKLFIIAKLEKVEREGMQDLVTFLENSDFFIAPASTKYHHNFPSGLARHSIGVYLKMLQLNDMLKWGIDEESMLLVGLLHDLCKTCFYVIKQKYIKLDNNGVPCNDGTWKLCNYYDYSHIFPAGHGEKSVFMINQYIKLSTEEIMAINYHSLFADARSSDQMGKKMISQAIKENKLLGLVGIADMLNSQYEGE